MKGIRPRHRRVPVIVVLVAVLGLVIAAAVVGVVHPRGGGSDLEKGLGSRAGLADITNSSGYRVAGGDGGATTPASPAQSESGSAGGGRNDIAAALPPVADGQYLVRIGSITLVVAKGRLQASVNQIVGIARLYDGYVLSSYSGTTAGTPLPLSETGDGDVIAVPERLDSTGAPYAYLTIRVPAERFDRAVTQIQALGKVRALTTSTDDVTGQVVDLRARLRHYRAVEARLLGFLDKAKTVGSALAVQDRIDQTQLQIEELQAQLKQLGETVTYSTLSVEISERGHPVAATSTADRGFWGTVKHSFGLMADGFGTIFTAFAAALPFLLLIVAVVVVVWLVARAVLRRRGARTIPATSEES